MNAGHVGQALRLSVGVGSQDPCEVTLLASPAGQAGGERTRARQAAARSGGAGPRLPQSSAGVRLLSRPPQQAVLLSGLSFPSHAQQQGAEPHAHAHGGEALLLPPLPSEFRQEREPQNSHSNAHWREALRLPVLQVLLCPQERLEEAHVRSHKIVDTRERVLLGHKARRQYISLCHVMLICVIC